MKDASAFQEALNRQFPFGCTARQLAAYFDNRAAIETVRQWRLGYRNPPQWAVDLLRSKTALAHAIAMQAKAGNHQEAGQRALDLYRRRKRLQSA